MDMLRFNFTTDSKPDCINVKVEHKEKVPRYTESAGYGFVDRTLGIYSRRLQVDRIMNLEAGYAITEDDATITWENSNQYDYGGLAFRVKVDEPGAYRIEVTISSEVKDTSVAISGMRADLLVNTFPWDLAGSITRQNKAFWKDRTWSYDYVTGGNHIDIEVEPLFSTDKKPQKVKATVGISDIKITKLDKKQRNSEIKPTIYILGDSTVCTYVFEEAGLCGWGQVIDELFELNQVEVINYAMGARSLKSMYCEGRLNEVLLAGKPGDYVLLQSGHNDEATGNEKGPEARFGRGATEQTYQEWINTVYIPSIASQNMQPVLVTPMTRIDCSKTTEDNIVFSGFRYFEHPGIDFPDIMKKTAGTMGIPVVDLYEESITYLKQIGGSTAYAMFLSVEAGELPSKMNTGSYANGNPYGSCDGTHFKEALAKQWARIIVTELWKKKLDIANYLKPSVIRAISTDLWEEVYPEIANDIQSKEGSYYRNQIEKLLQLGALKKDTAGCFHPKQEILTKEFINALCFLWSITTSHFSEYTDKTLTREAMGAIMLDAYELRFGRDFEGEFVKLNYMTDYNGLNLSPESPYYDPNLTGDIAQYFPLIPWEKVSDTLLITEMYYSRVKDAYHLGLIRCENGIRRDRMENGTHLEPKLKVTKEKAAKYLYFLWVISKDIHKKNDGRFE